MESRLLGLLKNVSSLAVVGASPQKGKIGYVILKNVMDFGYKGKVIPINPKYSEIEGLKVYRSLKEAPLPVDVAIVAVPESSLLEVLEEAESIGVKLAVIISSLSQESKLLEKALSDFSRKSVLRIIGPNSAGITIRSSLLHASIETPPILGSVGVAVQSGAIGGVVFTRLKELNSGVSFFFSLGNMLDVSINDALLYASEDNDTEAVIAYIEWVKDGRGFINSGLELKKRGKPLVILKGGRGEQSMEAARSHTGGITTSYELFRAAVKKVGAYLVDHLDELVEVTEVLRRIKLKEAPSPFIVTNSGGLGVVVASSLEVQGIEIKQPGTKVYEIIREKVKKRIPIRNPLDLGGDANIEDVSNVLCTDELKAEYNIAILSYVPTAAETPQDLLKGVLNTSKCFALPTIGYFEGEGSSVVTRHISSVIPVVSSSRTLTKALDAIMSFAKGDKKDG